MKLFGKFCLQHKILEKYRSRVCYRDEKDFECTEMSLSILIEKHTEMKQKQMKCSVYHSLVEACQKTILTYLKLSCVTKKEACIIQEYITPCETFL